MLCQFNKVLNVWSMPTGMQFRSIESLLFAGQISTMRAVVPASRMRKIGVGSNYQSLWFWANAAPATDDASSSIPGSAHMPRTIRVVASLLTRCVVVCKRICTVFVQKLLKACATTLCTKPYTHRTMRHPGDSRNRREVFMFAHETGRNLIAHGLFAYTSPLTRIRPTPMASLASIYTYKSYIYICIYAKASFGRILY